MAFSEYLSFSYLHTKIVHSNTYGINEMLHLYFMKYLFMLFLLPVSVQAQSFECKLDTITVIDPTLSSTNTVTIGSCVMHERIDAQTGRKEIFRRVDKMPIAGYDVISYLSKQLTFPASDSYKCTKTIVQFTIEESGNITHPRILKSCNPQIDDHILSVFRNMPKWLPAQQKGKPIATLYTLPILMEVK
jgi:hypothetical protein